MEGKKMKKMYKALFVIALLVFALGFATACNRDNEDEAEPTQAAVTPPPPVATNGGNGEDVTGEDETPAGRSGPGIHEPVDFGGRTLYVGCWWDNALPSAAMGWDEPDPAESTNYFIDRLIWENAQRVRSEFNVVLDNMTLGYGDMLPTLKSSVMAGAAFADVIMLSGGMQLSAHQGDLIVPIMDINLPNSDILGSQLYGLPLNPFEGVYLAIMCQRPYLNAFSIGVNMDIINSIGAPNPQELYRQGRWTWDAALEIMRMATRDTTGDGVFDQWGIAGQPGDLMFLFVGSNDGPMIDENRQFALDHPNTVEALEFMNIVFAEGLWQYDPVQGIDTGAWERNFFAFMEGNSALWAATTWAMNDGDLPFEFLGVPFPLGPSNTSGNTTVGGFRQAFTFPHSANWASADVLMIIEEFWSWPAGDPELKLESEQWPRHIWQTEECVQHIFTTGQRRGFDMGMVVPQYSWIFGTFVMNFINNEATPMQAIESVRASQQELIDNFFR